MAFLQLLQLYHKKTNILNCQLDDLKTVGQIGKLV